MYDACNFYHNSGLSNLAGQEQNLTGQFEIPLITKAMDAGRWYPEKHADEFDCFIGTIDDGLRYKQ